MAADASPDAKIPVALALIKLNLKSTVKYFTQVKIYLVIIDMCKMSLSLLIQIFHFFKRNTAPSYCNEQIYPVLRKTKGCL